MSSSIILDVAGQELEIELRDTPTAKKLLEALPLTSSANRWGDEVYFSVPVESRLEDDASAVMEIGEVGFWVEGHAIAIFFGPTPASHEKEPRAVEPINRVGKITGDVMLLKKVQTGDKVFLQKI